MILLILVLLGAGYYFTTPMERERIGRAALRHIRHLKDGADRIARERDPFTDALHARTSFVLVTPSLVAINAAVFFLMLFAKDSVADPDTLVRWGGNFGPSTTNGEWWRLVTAMFVHPGLLQLLANLVGLFQVGVLVERLFGRVACAAVYLGAGLIANLVNLFEHPVLVSAGASGAVFGMYGVCAVGLIWSLRQGVRTEAAHSLSLLTETTEQSEPVKIPLPTLTRFAPAAGLFIVYSLAAGHLGHAEIVGFVVGFAFGGVLVRGLGERKPSMLRVAAMMGTVSAMAVVSAVPLRGVANVKPEIERVIVIESQTAAAYDSAVHRFQNGQLTTAELAQVIDRTIVPELTAAHARLRKLDGVPREHQPLVAGAEEYFRLRETSWRVRAEGLRKANTGKLREAEKTERASLEALDRIRPAGPNDSPSPTGTAKR